MAPQETPVEENREDTAETPPVETEPAPEGAEPSEPEDPEALKAALKERDQKIETYARRYEELQKTLGRQGSELGEKRKQLAVMEARIKETQGNAPPPPMTAAERVNRLRELKNSGQYSDDEANQMVLGEAEERSRNFQRHEEQTRELMASYTRTSRLISQKSIKTHPDYALLGPEADSLIEEEMSRIAAGEFVNSPEEVAFQMALAKKLGYVVRASAEDRAAAAVAKQEAREQAAGLAPQPSGAAVRTKPAPEFYRDEIGRVTKKDLWMPPEAARKLGLK